MRYAKRIQLFSVDKTGNVWVADTFNRRVLRFPSNSKKADLVLGQDDFLSSDLEGCLDNAPLNRMCTPTLARVYPETGELYVIDERPPGFKARILVFKPPFKNGMSAHKVIIPKQNGEIEGWEKRSDYLRELIKKDLVAKGLLGYNDSKEIKEVTA